MNLKGSIISGEFDELMNEFSIETFKHFSTKSTLKGNQVHTLCEFLNKHKDELDGQFNYII